VCFNDLGLIQGDVNYIYAGDSLCMVRCFVAIECSNPDVVKGIRDVQNVLESTGAKLKSVEPENIHLTLKFLGEIDQSKVDEVAEVVEGMSFDAFSFKVEEVGVFPNLGRPATIWAGITDGVSDLAMVFEELDDRLSKLGFERERRRFQPHLTICRVKSGANKGQLVDELLRVKDTVFGEVAVDRVVLKKSVLTPSGPIYSTLAESHHS
jgi:2'-5' RNA ligase